MSDGIHDNTALTRFELDAGGATAFVTYQLADGVITFMHTETPPPARGRGIASQLVQGALEAARARGLHVVPRCTVVRAYIAKRPEFHDLLA